MALSRPLFVGFSSASKVAREGGDLEVTVQTARGPCTFLLPWFFVRDVDALLERWRREEHEVTLLTMNERVLGETLRQAAGAGGLRDTTFLLLARGADVNYGRYDWTALRIAASVGHMAVARVLLDAGANQLGSSLTKSRCSTRAPRAVGTFKWLVASAHAPGQRWSAPSSRMLASSSSLSCCSPSSCLKFL